ncbi:MAG: ABC transporter, partial [Chloroflexota bacterium]
MTHPSSRHPLTRLLGYARRHRRRVLLACLFSVLNKLFDLAPPALIGAAVDIVVQREDSFIASLGFPNVYDQLLVLALITLVIWIWESIFEYVHRILWRNLAQTIEHELRVETYAHVQDLE